MFNKDTSEIFEFRSLKSLQEISNIIRSVAGRLKADVQRLIYEDDPLGDFDNNAEPDIGVVLRGKVGFFGAFKHPRPGAANDLWGVQIQVFNEGEMRHVLLCALGDTSLFGLDNVFNVGASRERAQKLIEALED